MSGLPHDRPTASALDVVVEALGGFDLRDNRTPGPVGQNITGIHDQESISPQNVAPLIHRTDSVRIAVEADADICADVLHSADQVLQILHHRGIRMVIGELAVQLTVEPRHATAHLLQGRLGHQ